MNMISFLHFDNFNKQPEGFKNGLEMEGGDFGSFLLSFSFGQTAERSDNPKFEISPKGENISAEIVSDAELNAEETNKQTKDFQFFDEAFLPNEKPALPQNKGINWTEFKENELTEKKNVLKSEALADLQNFKASKSPNLAEKETVPEKLSIKNQQIEPSDVETGNENILQNKAETVTSKPPEINVETEDWVIQKDSTFENTLENKTPNVSKIKNAEPIDQPKIEPVKKPVSESEIEQIMESKFSAHEPTFVNESKNLSAEKIDLWQFKSPEFQDFKKTTETDSAEIDLAKINLPKIDSAELDLEAADSVDFEPLKKPARSQDLGKIENNDYFESAEKNPTKNADTIKVENKPVLKENNPTPEPLLPQKTETPKTEIADIDSALPPERVSKTSGDVKPTNPGDFAVEQMPDFEPIGQKEIEPQQNISQKLSDFFAPNREEIALKKGVDIIINENPKVNERLDLGEKRVTNLSNSNPLQTDVKQMPIDLGERAASRIPNTVPPPIHRQDLGEKAPNNLTNKFTKLIRKVSEAFDLSGSSNNILELNIDGAEIAAEKTDIKMAETFTPELKEKIKKSQPTLLSTQKPNPHNDKTQTPDILINETGLDAPKRQPKRIDTKTPEILDIDSPLENPKSKLTPAEPISLDKMVEAFRTNNSQMEGRNWAMNSVEYPVEFREIIEQLEAPVLEQVEKPLIEYLTSDEGLKKPEILKLRLHPAELGMVEVRFEKNASGKIEIHFQAESEIAKQILAEGFEGLQDALQDSGLQIERLEISNSLLSSSSFEAGGENLSEQEIIENREEKAELDDDLKNEDDESDRDEPERLVNLRA